MALQSYLFFGSANRLLEKVKLLLAGRPDCGFLLFDFRLVTGIDSSATYSFSQIKDAADAAGARLVLTNLSAELERAFRVAGFLSDTVSVAPNLDRALESCEQAVIEAHQEFQPGDVIARQGDAADSMHFILEGRVGIIVDQGERRALRVRSLGAKTTIGEMGLITQRPRSATIQAEAPSILYAFRTGDFEDIQRTHPALSQALLRYVTAVMAERLSFANRVIGILQR
jgi:SulP family sulfate permease